MLFWNMCNTRVEYKVPFSSCPEILHSNFIVVWPLLGWGLERVKKKSTNLSCLNVERRG